MRDELYLAFNSGENNESSNNYHRQFQHFYNSTPDSHHKPNRQSLANELKQIVEGDSAKSPISNFEAKKDVAAGKNSDIEDKLNLILT